MKEMSKPLYRVTHLSQLRFLGAGLGRVPGTVSRQRSAEHQTPHSPSLTNHLMSILFVCAHLLPLSPLHPSPPSHRIISKKSVSSVMNERNLLSQLKHNFLVNMFFAFQDRENLYLVMDLMPGGDLRYHIGRQRRFSEEQTSKKRSLKLAQQPPSTAAALRGWGSPSPSLNPSPMAFISRHGLAPSSASLL